MGYDEMGRYGVFVCYGAHQYEKFINWTSPIRQIQGPYQLDLSNWSINYIRIRLSDSSSIHLFRKNRQSVIKVIYVIN